MITFYEKDPKGYISAWFGCIITYVEVWMRLEDGREYLIFDRKIRSSKPDKVFELNVQEELHTKDYLINQLKANGGAWCNTYGTCWATKETRDNDPVGFLKTVRDRGYHLEKNISEFTVEPDGSATFSGNLTEYSSAFRYRIFSKEMIDTLRRLLSPDEILFKDYS